METAAFNLPNNTMKYSISVLKTAIGMKKWMSIWIFSNRFVYSVKN